MENMENKLTIEHLAPYLPFELYVKVDGDLPQGVLVSICAGMAGLLLFEENDSIEYYDFSDIKPLLVPMSKLAEWMELPSVGEHQTIPIYELFKDEQPLDLWQERDLFLEQRIPEILIEKAKENHFGWDYCKWELLFKWHFDVFGLIEKGLAIDETSI